MREWLVLVVFAALGTTGCGNAQSVPNQQADIGPADAADTSDAAAPPRTQSFTTTIDASGFSAPIEFVVPSATRSITVVIIGADDRLYALGAFRLADGVERTRLDTATVYGPAMRDAYVKEQSGLMPGDLYQSIRLGTFTHIYPYAPGQAVAGGAAMLRVVSDANGGAVSVHLYMPEDDGARTLHINALAVSESLEMSKSPSFLGEAQRIFDQTGIRLVVDDAITIKGSGLSSMLDLNEPQEPPNGGAAAIAKLGATRVTTSSLNVFVVDALATGVGGLSLGTPGPPEPSSYYFGVLLRRGSDIGLGRVFAHEVCHFLGLQHVTNKGTSGTVYPDPIADTEPGRSNLMENGTTLTEGQAFALSKSPLLTK